MLTATRPSGKVARMSATPKVRLAHVLKYENADVVERITKEHKMSVQDATILFKDMLRFLWLSHTYGKIAPSSQIDKAWHEFLMFTMDYQKFCHKYFGRFIHHNPRRTGDKVQAKEVLARTHEIVQRHFCGVIPTNWLRPRIMRCGPDFQCWSCT